MYAQLLQEGKTLKLLATAARLDVEDFLQKKVFLEVPIYTLTLISIFFLFHKSITSFKGYCGTIVINTGV